MIKRIDLRLNLDNPKEMEILQKIENRNQSLYRNPKDYIIQALYAFENKNYEEQTQSEILREELEKVKRERSNQKMVEKAEMKVEIDPDIWKFLG